MFDIAAEKRARLHAVETELLTYAKVCAMTRIATPATEDGWLSIALNGTAARPETAAADARARQGPRPAAASAACTGRGRRTGRCG